MAEDVHDGGRPRRFHLTLPFVVAVAVASVAVAGAVTAVAVGRSHAAAASRRHAAVRAGRHRSGHAAPAPTPALVVDSVSPGPGSGGVGFDAPVTVRFSTALSSRSPLPTLIPAVPGTWERLGPDVLAFRPTGNYAPYAHETVYVPAGRDGAVSAGGRELARPFVSHFAVRSGSTLRLQQLLAELGYLPVTFMPSSANSQAQASTAANAAAAAASGAASAGAGRTNATAASTTTTTTTGAPPGPSGPPGPTGTVLSAAPATPSSRIDEPNVASDIPLAPLAGSFSWRYDNIPPSLAALWTPGTYNVVTEGAVMQFELANGLATDGVAGPRVWADLLRAVAARQVDTAGYDYVFVDTGSPEYVNLWRNGTVIFQTLANTGIPQAPTELGTWPVYVRYTVTTMSGTEPNGQHYSDPGIPWVSYFHGGDALHGYLRAQYGYPQSLGCVEMPYSSAKVVYPYTPIGTLVTVL